MSDRPERPPDDDPPAWAPFGRTSDDEPAAPLWSGDDPVAAPPDAPATPPDEGAPVDVSGSEPRQHDSTPVEPAPAPTAPPRFAPPAAPAPAPPAGWAAPEAPATPGWPPPPPAPGGGTWPPAGPQPPHAGGKVPGSAVAALVLGVVGLVVCPFVCSVAAIILGVQARRQIDGTPGLTGRGQATAGIVLGVIGIAFFVLVLVTGIGGGIGTTI